MDTTVRKLKGKCEHGAEITKEIHMPLHTEIWDMAEEEDALELCVWLMGADDDELQPISVHHCSVEAELVNDAMKVFLATLEGQERALEYVKHERSLEEVTN